MGALRGAVQEFRLGRCDPEIWLAAAGGVPRARRRDAAAWIDRCPNQLYSALVFQGGAAWRKRLKDEIGDQGAATKLIGSRSDDELAPLMNNLGGHDLPSIVEAFDRIDHDRPTCFIAYTIKGFGLPFAGHKDNHAGLMTPAQMESFRQTMNIRAGHEWDRFEGLSENRTAPARLSRQRARSQPEASAVSRRRVFRRRTSSPSPSSKKCQHSSASARCSTNWRERRRTLVARIVTTSPDVTVSTNLGPWVNRRGLFAREALADTFKSERIPSTFNWEFSPQGPAHRARHRREQSVHAAVGARPVAHSINGERLIPIGTLVRSVHRPRPGCANYACYQDARFIIVATPSG